MDGFRPRRPGSFGTRRGNIHGRLARVILLFAGACQGQVPDDGTGPVITYDPQASFLEDAVGTPPSFRVRLRAEDVSGVAKIGVELFSSGANTTTIVPTGHTVYEPEQPLIDILIPWAELVPDFGEASVSELVNVRVSAVDHAGHQSTISETYTLRSRVMWKEAHPGSSLFYGPMVASDGSVWYPVDDGAGGGLMVGVRATGGVFCAWAPGENVFTPTQMSGNTLVFGATTSVYSLTWDANGCVYTGQRYGLPGANEPRGAPVYDPDPNGPRVWVATDGGMIYALNPSNIAAAQFSLSLPARFVYGGVLDNNHNFVIGSSAPTPGLYAFDGAGTQVWSDLSIGGTTSDIVVAGNSFYVGANDGRVHSFDLSSKAPNWHGVLDNTGSDVFQPGVGGGMVVATTSLGMYAFDVTSGDMLWNNLTVNGFHQGPLVNDSPSVAVFAGNSVGEISRLSQQGQLLWQFTVQDPGSLAQGDLSQRRYFYYPAAQTMYAIDMGSAEPL